MVVKHRNQSTAALNNMYIDPNQNRHFSLPYAYGSSQLQRASSTGCDPKRPQTPPIEVYDSLSPENKNRSLNLVSITFNFFKLAFILAASYSINKLRTELKGRESELAAIRDEFIQLENKLSQNEDKFLSAKDSILDLQSKFLELLPEGETLSGVIGDEFNSEIVYKRIVEKQYSLKNRVHVLQENLVAIHRKDVIEMFGVQPYRLMVNLRIKDEIYSFVIEMAPLELMPHSVHYFLEMIAAHLWDNTIFSHNVNHIVVAELRDSEGNNKHIESFAPFIIPEYNNDYQHEKYTLGFALKSESPMFYINSNDNRNVHGPGGQGSVEADPCFARVVEGHNVVDWMMEKSKVPTSDESFTMIESIRLIG